MRTLLPFLFWFSTAQDCKCSDLGGVCDKNRGKFEIEFFEIIKEPYHSLLFYF